MTTKEPVRLEALGHFFLVDCESIHFVYNSDGFAKRLRSLKTFPEQSENKSCSSDELKAFLIR